MPDRECGECSACCYVAEVEQTTAAYSTCPHLTDGARRCSLYGTPARPAVCSAFQCAWLRGFGEESHRPDLSGVLLTTNVTRPGRWACFAGELEPGAVRGRAASLVAAFARAHAAPVIVVEADCDSAGRWIVLRADLVDRAAAMVGPVVCHLADDVLMFERTQPEM